MNVDRRNERILHEKDSLVNIQIEQTKGITGIFYKMYIDDSRKFALRFQGKTILDIGAGDGIILSGSGLNPIEMDIAIERCRRLKQTQKRIICGSGFEIPLKDNSVDCVLLIAILEHASNPKLIIDEVYRVLRKSGEAAILVPNDIMMSIGRILLLKFPPRYPGHINFVTPMRLGAWIGERFEITGQYNLPFKKLSFWFSMYHFIYIKKR